MRQAFVNMSYKLQILAQWIRAQRKNMSTYGCSTVKSDLKMGEESAF